jgi:beta-xylosidase
VTASADPTDFSHGTGRTVLLDDAGAFIDPSPYIDPVSGGLYLVYKQRPTSMTGSHVHIRPMRNPTTFSGPATLLISSADVPMSEAIVEQPMMFHAGGVYFLLFSTGNGATTTYRIDYATSANLTGPFNYRGTIFRTNADTSVPLSRRVIAPGSSSIVRDGAGDPWMVYRQKTTLEDTFANRGVCIDPIEIDPAARAIRGMPTKGVTRPAPAPL